MSGNGVRIATCALVLWGALAAGCVSDETRANALMAATSDARATAPLGGEALLQRKLELERTFRDLEHFNTTLESLQWRDDRNGKVMFSEFVDHYLAKQVLPILEGEWQSRHPEVAVLDADVRLGVAELWFRIGATSRTDRMLEEIERRYAGRGDMVVSYPFGSQGTLHDGVARLRDRGWWNG
jgi:hypothetical protein